MNRTIAALLLTAVGLVAADVSGAWSGTVKGKRDDGTPLEDTAHLVLKQEGTTVTGTAGGHPGDQRPISSGKMEGDSLTFEVVAERGTFKVALQLSGESLAGEVRRENDGQVVRIAALELKRVK